MNSSPCAGESWQRVSRTVTNRFALLSFVLLLSAPGLLARDVFVMLSGGVSPWANNYSQYLQARAVVTWLEQNYPRDSVWAFFGAGNIEGEEPIMCDVRREEIRDGRTEEIWLAGSISRNRPARRDVFLKALREEILPAVANGGTLYLFVGDHGSQSRGTNAESLIDMWSVERDHRSERKWRTIRNASLPVSELRQALADGIGQGRVVFCMTQCHSGGFHHLAVPRSVAPNARWFTEKPVWLAPVNPFETYVRAAGFTATDERSLAAGCQADPDYLRWAGYERYVPERLFGWDMFKLEPNAPGLRSFAEAHEAATLIDQTIDKPYSTSEQYLERWANLIDTRLARATNLTPRAQRSLAAYQRTVDGATPREVDLLFRQRQAQFRRFTERLGEQNTNAAKWLFTGTRKELEDAAGLNRRSSRGSQSRTNATQSSTNRLSSRLSAPQTNAVPRTNATARVSTNAPTETQKQWLIIRPAWSDAVEAGRAESVVGAAVEFEKFLLREEAKGWDFFSSTSRAALREEAFWRSGYSEPRRLDTNTAQAVMRWSRDRRTKITQWARESEEEPVREAAQKLLARSSRTNSPSTNVVSRPVVNPGSTNFTPRPISTRIAAERALFYRRTLAAWEFLLAMNERQALAKIRELTELERTPFPRPEKRTSRPETSPPKATRNRTPSSL